MVSIRVLVAELMGCSWLGYKVQENKKSHSTETALIEATNGIDII